MHYLKVLGLAAVAAMAVMASIGAATASAQDEITLCKALETLCAPGNLWPAKTKITALSSDSELVASGGFTTPIKCEDSIVTGLSEKAVGNPLNFDSVSVAFGKLPTPKLGAGCTGTCTNGAEENIHPVFEATRILVEPTDKYYLLGEGLAELLHCTVFNVTCIYRSKHVKVPINHDGKHAGHPGAENLALVRFEIELERKTEHNGKSSGSTLCPATSTWKATYTILLAEDPLGNTGLAWPALDKP